MTQLAQPLYQGWQMQMASGARPTTQYEALPGCAIMELWGADCLSPLSAFTSQCKQALRAKENMLTWVWWPHKFHWHCVGHLVSTGLYDETGIFINVTLRNPSSVNVLEPSHF